MLFRLGATIRDQLGGSEESPGLDLHAFQMLSSLPHVLQKRIAELHKAILEGFIHYYQPALIPPRKGEQSELPRVIEDELAAAFSSNITQNERFERFVSTPYTGKEEGLRAFLEVYRLGTRLILIPREYYEFLPNGALSVAKFLTVPSIRLEHSDQPEQKARIEGITFDEAIARPMGLTDILYVGLLISENEDIQPGEPIAGPTDEKYVEKLASCVEEIVIEPRPSLYDRMALLEVHYACQHTEIDFDPILKAVAALRKDNPDKYLDPHGTAFKPAGFRSLLYDAVLQVAKERWSSRPRDPSTMQDELYLAQLFEDLLYRIHFHPDFQ